MEDPQASVTLTDSNFQEQVLENDRPVLVDFWAPWCRPCRVMGPMVEELAREFESEVTVAKLNVDEYQEIAMRLDIYSLPTLAIFKGGRLLHQMVGIVPKQVLASRLAEVVRGA